MTLTPDDIDKMASGEAPLPPDRLLIDGDGHQGHHPMAQRAAVRQKATRVLLQHVGGSVGRELRSAVSATAIPTC